MHTSTYVDFIDEFVETIVQDENGQPGYKYGDEIRPLNVGEVTLKYRDGEEVSERTFPT
jgi:acyl-homoserine lactone acylase PvdQ